MNDLKTVIKFTMKEMVTRKSFLISSLIIIAIIILGFNVPNIMSHFNNDDSSNKLLIVDNQNVFEGNLETLNNIDFGYEIEITNENLNFEDIKEKIEKEEVRETILVEKDNENIKMRYIIQERNMMTMVPEDVINMMNSIYSNMQITKLGLTEEEISSITPNFEFVLEQTEEQEVQGNIFVMMALSGVLFYAIYFCASLVSTSITTEKTSKLMETLVTSTKPRTIVVGKTIGIGVVGLIQICVFVIITLICANTFIEPEMLNALLDMSSITPYLGIITVIYFILGYFAYSMLYALTGSTVGKPEDIQSANTPVAILIVVGFYLSYFTMMNPTSSLNIFASMLPISSPFCMPFRVMMGLANGTDVAISIAILVATIALVAHIAIRIYSSAILNYGTKMTFKDMVKMYKDKNN